MKKKMILVILVIFPISGNNGKYIKIYDMKKKNFVQKIEFWATAQVYCKKMLYCNIGCWGLDCVTIQFTVL